MYITNGLNFNQPSVASVTHIPASKTHAGLEMLVVLGSIVDEFITAVGRVNIPLSTSSLYSVNVVSK